VNISRHLVKDAAVVFTAAYREQPEECAEALAGLHDRHGGEGLAQAVILWCDAYVDHARGGQPRTNLPVKLIFMEEDGEQATVDQVPPELVWAGRLLAARCAWDRDTFIALLSTVPDGEDGRWVVALLQVVTSVMRRLPRGYGMPETSRGEVSRE
jgi:hypothetical protein